jgi:hypothetical protein
MTTPDIPDLCRRLRRAGLKSSIEAAPILERQAAILERQAAEIERLRGALKEIAEERSPFDHTGEPLQVRISKDLSRRIEEARAALTGEDTISVKLSD